MKQISRVFTVESCECAQHRFQGTGSIDLLFLVPLMYSALAYRVSALAFCSCTQGWVSWNDCDLLRLVLWHVHLKPSILPVCMRFCLPSQDDWRWRNSP
eukprot:5227867-Amphidinium_carterae.1